MIASNSKRNTVRSLTLGSRRVSYQSGSWNRFGRAMMARRIGLILTLRCLSVQYLPPFKLTTYPTRIPFPKVRSHPRIRLNASPRSRST